MDGYVSKGKPIFKRYQGKRYSIQQYQGEHGDEFSVMEIDGNGVENGIAQLFKKGVIQMFWNMKNGKREGVLTLYKKGLVDRLIRWDDMQEADKQGSDYHLHVIVKSMDGKELLEEMIVGSGIVVYRGEFDSESRKREGFGIEYDEESGLEKRSGYFRNGKLVHLCQEFEQVKNDQDDGKGNKMEMIEYGGEKDEDNVDNIFKRLPVYVGDYVFDAKQSRFIRSGMGNVLNEYCGTCDHVSEWNEKGEENKSSILPIAERDKGYNPMNLRDVVRFDEDKILCADLNIWCRPDIKEFKITHSQYNGGNVNESVIKLWITDLSQLIRIEIGNNCFTNVREFVIDGLESLENMKIGEKCFRIGDDRERDDGVCRIKNCPKLRKVEIGNDSYQEFKSFELVDVNSLESIDFGNNCFSYSDFSIKGSFDLNGVIILLYVDLQALKTIIMKYRSFEYCHIAVLESKEINTINIIHY